MWPYSLLLDSSKEAFVRLATRFPCISRKKYISPISPYFFCLDQVETRYQRGQRTLLLPSPSKPCPIKQLQLKKFNNLSWGVRVMGLVYSEKRVFEAKIKPSKHLHLFTFPWIKLHFCKNPSSQGHNKPISSNEPPAYPRANTNLAPLFIIFHNANSPITEYR